MDMKFIGRYRISLYLLSLFLQNVKFVNTDGIIPGVELSLPPSHTALSGDLHLQILAASFPPLLLQLARLDPPVTAEAAATVTTLTTFPVLPEARALQLNATLVRIPCGYFSRGGQYYVLLKRQPIRSSDNDDYTTYSTTHPAAVDGGDGILMRTLDVRWPMPQLTLTPEHVQTYPQRPVMAVLEFPEVECPPRADTAPSAIPEFWLELHYCGHSLLTCDSGGGTGVLVGDGVAMGEEGAAAARNSSLQILYSEQVRGFPGRRMITLRCELFGLAGYYSLVLRPTTPTPSLPHTAAYVKADWSDEFVFNVHASSIFPCDPHNGGITVLFQYPSCILAGGDRVRLYARLRADVASLAPPTTLEYVAEQRVQRGQHSLHFECDLFGERYIEYCFVYVSEAITGAVADVRMDCVPTLPVTEAETGGWGTWSKWTPCSSTCLGGTRSRYRFCDSPAPRYGAKFCEGDAVETEQCGSSLGSGWECFYTTGGGNSIYDGDNSVPAELPEVAAEVGPYCRCGCVVHLGHAKPRRLLATSSHSCPGRTFWLIQADEDYMVQFKVEQFRLPCGTQYLKIRDGSSSAANLLYDLTDPNTTPATVNSTGSNLLLEFYSDDMATSSQFCGGGFLAYAVQFKVERNLSSIPVAQQGLGVLPLVALKLTAVHVAAIFFLSGLIIATALLGAQYVFRYRKYHIAQAEDQDSLTDISGSCNSLPMSTVRAATSNATLLSEVISLHRLRPNINKTRHKHTRLRESVDCDEQLENVATLAKEEESLSLSSTSTLTPEDTINITVDDLPPTTSECEEDDTNRDLSLSTTSSQIISEDKKLRRSSTIVSGDKDKSTEKEAKEVDGNRSGNSSSGGSGSISGRTMPIFSRRPSNVSVANLTNVSFMSALEQQRRAHSRSETGSYSPALSTTSTATVRSTNPKESKDKRNRERLLAGPVGSEFSLVGPDMDLELDYYDYNVVNAGAAPGSYLGMDPAFLVWIPPLDESGEILDDVLDSTKLPDIRPSATYIDPRSNGESPEEEPLLQELQLRPRALSDVVVTQEKLDALRLTRRRSNNRCPQKVLLEERARLLERHDEKLGEEIVSIQLHEFPSGNRRKMDRMGGEREREKETRVEKSPSVEEGRSGLDDIKFADDEDGELARGLEEEEEEEEETDEDDNRRDHEIKCNILAEKKSSYQDKSLVLLS